MESLGCVVLGRHREISALHLCTPPDHHHRNTERPTPHCSVLSLLHSGRYSIQSKLRAEAKPGQACFVYQQHRMDPRRCVDEYVAWNGLKERRAAVWGSLTCWGHYRGRQKVRRGPLGIRRRSPNPREFELRRTRRGPPKMGGDESLLGRLGRRFGHKMGNDLTRNGPRRPKMVAWVRIRWGTSRPKLVRTVGGPGQGNRVLSNSQGIPSLVSSYHPIIYDVSRSFGGFSSEADIWLALGSLLLHVLANRSRVTLTNGKATPGRATAIDSKAPFSVFNAHRLAHGRILLQGSTHSVTH